MNRNDLENELKNARFCHLTQAELVSYCDQELDNFSLARADAHLKLCLICDRRLSFLKEERAALANREVTDADVAMVRRVMQEMGLRKQPHPKPEEDGTSIPSPYQLAEYLRQIVEDWQAHFMQLAVVRGKSGTSEEVWSWQSEDGVLKARAILEKNADLTIHLSTNDFRFEGVRLNIRLGPVSRETILQRLSDSEVYARVEVPRRQRPKNLADISIEVI
jgi:hypothetical protein